MTVPLITLYTGVIPDRLTQDASTFTINSIDWLNYQVVQIPSTNTAIAEINNTALQINLDEAAAAASAAAALSSENAAAASANFKGRWVDLTGALNIPATVERSDRIYQLLESLADVTLEDPLTSSKWLVVDEINMANVNVSELENPLFHGFAKNDLVRVMNSVTVLTSDRDTIATSVDINRVVRTAGIDDPREEESGWLFEGANTNELIRTEEFDNAAWVKSGILSVTANSALAPDGSTNMDKIIPNTSNSTHSVDQAVSSDGTLVYTVTYFISDAGYTAAVIRVRGGGGGGFGITVDIAAKTVTPIADFGGGQILNSSVKDMGNNILKVTFSGIPQTTATATVSTDVRVLQSAVGSETFVGDGISGINLWGGDLKQLPFDSSYIKSIATPETRSADNILFPVEGNFRESQGMIFLKADVIGDVGISQHILNINDGSSANRIAIFRGSDKIRLLITTDGVTQADISTSFNMDPFTQYVIAVNYADNNVELFVDGVSIGTDTSATMPTGLTTVNAGQAASGFNLFGHIQDLRLLKAPRNIDEIKYLGGQ